MGLYDLAIIGDGPAGCSGSLYGVRAGLKTVLIGSGNIGGQIAQTDLVDNYPGIPDIAGFDLGQKLYDHAVQAGTDIYLGTALNVSRNDQKIFCIDTDNGPILSRTLICATGASPRKAGFVGEETYIGRGVSYCATCDAMFYRNKNVYVVGGGKSACEEALYLSRFASKVIMLVRKDHMRAPLAIVSRLASVLNIEVRFNSELKKLKGDSLPTSVEIFDNAKECTYEESYDQGSFGVFVFVGADPNTSLIADFVDLSSEGGVITGEDMSTKTPGLFCAGDIRSKYLKQVITAVSDGAIAATAAAHFLL